MQNSLLEMENVSLQYQADKSILRQINLKIPEKSFHFISGASGVGKTSLLKLICMAQQPNSGKLRLFGADLQSLSEYGKIAMRRRLGIIFQDYKLVSHLNVFDNVALPLRIAKQGADDINYVVQDIINWVGLKDKMDDYPETLSGGEQQRLAIARACITKPEVLIADEPTANIDDAGALKSMHLFEEMHKRGCSVIFATHNYKLIGSYNYPLFYLEDSHIRYFATPQDIDYKHAKLFT